MSRPILSIFTQKQNASAEPFNPLALITWINSESKINRSLFSLGESEQLLPSSPSCTDVLPFEVLLFATEVLERGQSIGYSTISTLSDRYLVVVEAIKSRTSLIILGAGHVGKTLALMGAFLGYEVTIFDDRKNFLSDDSIPDPTITKIHIEFEDLTDRIIINTNSAIAIVTRGHQHDEVCLKTVLRSDAKYIGMIGSKRRILGVLQRLHNYGFSETETSRVFAPIGLSIHAKTPQEIAVSILAQIIQVMNN